MQGLGRHPAVAASICLVDTWPIYLTLLFLHYT
nr:MAG TPA: hypothetical protein [Caudoviricetes sp.]